MFCMNCGAQLSDTAKFCGSCGTKVELPDLGVPAAAAASVPANNSAPAETAQPAQSAQPSQAAQTINLSKQASSAQTSGIPAMSAVSALLRFPRLSRTRSARAPAALEATLPNVATVNPQYPRRILRLSLPNLPPLTSPVSRRRTRSPCSSSTRLRARRIFSR